MLFVGGGGGGSNLLKKAYERLIVIQCQNNR